MPNPLKAQVKIGTINELGNNLDDLKEGAEKEALRLEGYARALSDMEKGIASVAEALNVELKETEFDGYVGEPLKIAELVKRYITRCMGCADNLKVRNQKSYLIQQGQVLGLVAAIKQAHKMVESEAKKIQAPVDITGPIPQTAVGSDAGRPDMSAAEDIAQRRLEAKKAKESKALAKAAKAKTSKKPRKTVTCGRCGVTGHTARSCSKKKDASNI